ncbi:hypothetical protein ACB092_10G009200 [Castanea dentata]
MIIEELLTNVSDQDNLAIYAVWGMGGLGKTTLAQLVYNDQRVERHFEVRIWVCVSDDFQIKRLVRAIIESMEGSACSLVELDPLQQRLQEKLRGRKFLLVLDDVWNENHEKWDGLKDALRCGVNGSKVIVTTRIEKVALMMATLPIHHMGCLSEDDSWSLFKGRAFRMRRVEEKLELESIGKEIVKKCGGVPLAIKALGSLMCLKSMKSEWLSVKESQIWDLPVGENTILLALRLSYHHLPPHLKQCFAYCCVFPKDHDLEMDELIKLWMANGFIPLRRSMELHDVGLDIFNELVWRSFFQDVREARPGYTMCKMHDLMHDLAMSIMKFECSTLEFGKELKVPYKIRHLSFTMVSSIEDIYEVQSIRSCIGKATDYNCEHEAFLSFLLKQKYLRVWDFDYEAKTLLRSISNLKHLRYLDISFSTIKVLPESTSCLLNLQTLKVNNCQSLCKLPNGMKHMKNLMYLENNGCDSLTCMPEGMGQLICLQSLSCFIVGKDNGYQISELKGLNLRNHLRIVKLGNVRNLLEAKTANLIGKQNLHSLSLVWQSDIKSCVLEQVEDVLDGLQPHSNLKKLIINNYHGSKFPTWMQDLFLHNLIEIQLLYCKRCELLPPLGKLPFLMDLDITSMHAVKSLGNEFHGDSAISFPSLRSFRLCHMNNLEEWRTINGRKSFPHLSSLSIVCCPKLVELPIIPSLTSLFIHSCPKIVELPIIPSLTSLCIDICSAMLISSVMNLTSLSDLTILSMEESIVLPDGLFQQHKMLESLNISLVRNLKPLANQLNNLSTLKDLRLNYCDKVENLLDALQNMHSLMWLEITGCENLLSFPVNGLLGLSSLRKLWIQNCKAFYSLSEGIQYLTKLEDLFINGCPKLMSLPEGIQHLTALRTLHITLCEGLSSLPKQIGCLTLLSYLKIEYCSNLRSMPEELKNLTALKKLRIVGCPHLKKRCKKDRGEDWHNISHIPKIEISDRL